MRMESLVREALGLQVHRVVRVVKADDGSLEAHLERIRRRRLVCGTCGRKAPYRDRRPLRRWRDLFVLTHSLVVVYAPCRTACPACGVSVEAVPWAAPRARVTRRLALELAVAARKASWTDVARRFQVDWKTVVAVVRAAVEWGLGRRKIKPVRVLGVDEVSRKKGQNYLTLFWDLGRKNLLWVGEDRTEAAGNAFFAWFGPRRAENLQAVCLDMWRPYMNAVRRAAPQSVMVFDRFHLVRHLGEAVDRVRRQMVRAGAAAIKGTRYLWLTNPWNLRPEQRLRLGDLLKSNLPIVRAYILKEAFHKLFDYRSKAAAQRWLKMWFWMATHSRLGPLRDFAWMVRRHEAGILAWTDLRISNGLVEGMNNKIALVKRRAFGLRKPEYQKLAIYHCLANLPLPPA